MEEKRGREKIKNERESRVENVNDEGQGRRRQEKNIKKKKIKVN